MAGSEVKAVSPKTLVWIERLVWILLYGGLLIVTVGLFLTLGAPEGRLLGSVLMAKGGMIAGAGVFLIWLRSRLKSNEDKQKQP